ncbi:hypothetical protein BAUCODRAFT_127386 [Baudoinia panamericana UAMH 10762]|uniref:Uncharacterized protein n=1 Tax=Baudoinia panamericana (strain UAMH 10762) TaxID=717646 RepID=M2MXX4_BAUPA|nr:uncharacterized protein BAUCODRAFT_127386 [Baudoinia panamericana UAMH 10762]EMC91489.1 hypothetical protein BAUCODRAFT_127386 [Baudoinia panamericana UAMH 10762]
MDNGDHSRMASLCGIFSLPGNPKKVRFQTQPKACSHSVPELTVTAPEDDQESMAQAQITIGVSTINNGHICTSGLTVPLDLSLSLMLRWLYVLNRWGAY